MNKQTLDGCLIQKGERPLSAILYFPDKQNPDSEYIHARLGHPNNPMFEILDFRPSVIAAFNRHDFYNINDRINRKRLRDCIYSSARVIVEWDEYGCKIGLFPPKVQKVKYYLWWGATDAGVNPNITPKTNCKINLIFCDPEKTGKNYYLSVNSIGS